MSTPKTLAPCLASRTAVALPLPQPSPTEPAPVTNATFPVMFSMGSWLLVRKHTSFARLDLEREEMRVDARVRETAPDDPETPLRRRAEHVGEFAVRGDAPDLANLPGDVFAQEVSQVLARRLITGGGDEQIGGSDTPVLQARAASDEAVDVVVLDQADVAVDDQFRAATLEVVSAVTAAELHLMAGFVLTEIELEAAPAQAFEEVLVDLLHPLHRELVAAHEQRIGADRGNEIGVFGRQALVVVDRVDELGRVQTDHRGGAALDDVYGGAEIVQVLRDVVAARARTEHKSFLAFPLRARLILMRVQDSALE